MSTKFTCGSSPIYEYPSDIPPHPAGVCDMTCPICIVQQAARTSGRAKIIGTCTWSGVETHSALRRSFFDWLLGRPGRWVRG